MKYCSTCGAGLEDWQKFCPQCDRTAGFTIIQVKRGGGPSSMLNKFEVIVDGQRLEKVGYLKTVEFRVPVGGHQLMVKCYSQTSDLLNLACRSGSTIRLECGTKGAGVPVYSSARMFVASKASLYLVPLASSL